MWSWMARTIKRVPDFVNRHAIRLIAPHSRLNHLPDQGKNREIPFPAQASLSGRPIFGGQLRNTVTLQTSVDSLVWKLFAGLGRGVALVSHEGNGPPGGTVEREATRFRHLDGES